MKSFTIDSITESFPNSSLPKFEEEPIYNKKKIECLLIENALSIQSTLGGGNHRYLRLNLSSAKRSYTSISNR